MVNNKLLMKEYFNGAKERKARYFAVLISMDGFPGLEVIINPLMNIDKKTEYYDKTYDDNLIHKFSPGIKIVDFVSGETFDEIQEILNTRE